MKLEAFRKGAGSLGGRMFSRLWTRLRAALSPPEVLPQDPIDEARNLSEAGKYAEALRLLRPLAESGDRVAQRMLGHMFVNGLGVMPNPAEAVRWLKQAANAGDELAQHHLALIYALGQSGIEARSVVSKWYTAMIDGGNALAVLDAHDLFPDGMTVPQDFATAAAWARKSAEAGNTDAQTNLGVFLLRGKGVAQDISEATAWFETAAAQGSAKAKAHLGLLLSEGPAPDWNQAYQLMKEASDANDPLAQVVLGRWYLHGHGNRAVDAVQGVVLLAAAAAQGSPDAQFTLGMCAKTGTGMAKDLHQAVSCWRRASEKGHATATLCLGKLYGSGELGVRHEAEAARLLERAAQHGLPEAQLLFGRYVLVGAGVPQSFPEAHAWFLKSFQQLDTPEVRYELGRVLMFMADGTPTAEALAHLESAATNGNADALTLLARLGADGKVAALAGSAFPFLDRAATAGHVPALALRADLVLKGEHILPQAYRTDCLTAAAEAGHPPALLHLAVALAHGSHGFAKDEAQAFKWFETAAMAGNITATRSYGWMLVQGVGCAADPLRGVEYLRRAADKGDSGAMYALGQVALDGLVGESDRAIAMHWFKASADRGNETARAKVRSLDAAPAEGSPRG